MNGSLPRPGMRVLRRQCSNCNLLSSECLHGRYSGIAAAAGSPILCPQKHCIWAAAEMHKGQCIQESAKERGESGCDAVTLISSSSPAGQWCIVEVRGALDNGQGQDISLWGNWQERLHWATRCTFVYTWSEWDRCNGKTASSGWALRYRWRVRKHSSEFILFLRSFPKEPICLASSYCPMQRYFYCALCVFGNLIGNREKISELNQLSL